MIRRFKETTGMCVEKIAGQRRFAFAHSGSNDFYDLAEWTEKGGYQGSVLLFFDFDSGDIYKPFPWKRGVMYGDPVYAEGFYYFLRGDDREKKIALYRCVPGELLEKVTEWAFGEVSLYNLRVIGNPVRVISQDDEFECYYPEKLSFPLSGREAAVLMEDDKIYFCAWVEEGWDEEKNCATDYYKYYHKVVVRDYGGNILSEEIGDLCQAADGTWWIT